MVNGFLKGNGGRYSQGCGEGRVKHMKKLSNAKVIFGVLGYSYFVILFNYLQLGLSFGNYQIFIQALGGAVAIIGFAGGFYLIASIIYLFIIDKTNRERNCIITFIIGAFLFSIPPLLGF